MRDGRLSKVVDGKSPLLASHRAAGGRTSLPWRRRRITHRSPPRRSISEPQNQLHAGQGSSLQGNLQGNRSTGEAALGWEGLTWLQGLPGRVPVTHSGWSWVVPGAPVPPSVERHVPLDGTRFRQYPGSSTWGRRPAVRGDLHFSVHSVRAQYTLTCAHLCLYIRTPWQKPEIPSAAGSKVLPKAPASLLQHSPCT